MHDTTGATKEDLAELTRKMEQELLKLKENKLKNPFRDDYDGPNWLIRC